MAVKVLVVQYDLKDFVRKTYKNTLKTKKVQCSDPLELQHQKAVV